MNRKTSLLLLAATVWWLLNGLAVGAEWMRMHDAGGHAIAWSRAMPASLIGALGWIPLTLGLFWLVRWRPIEPGRVAYPLALYCGAVAAVVLLRAIYIYGLDDWLHWYDTPPTFSEVLLQSFWNNVFQTWLLIGVAHAVHFGERARERDAQATRLQAQLADARLAALSSQLNPHFLFNALNSIAELVHRDADAADRMIVGLAALLRSSLETSGSNEVPLQEELRLLGHYLDIEKIRLGERLRVDWAVAPEVLGALVPPLVLQPLVENAIRHGISRRFSPGRIAVHACRDGGRLLLEVQDDGGQDAHGDGSGGTGIGLATTRARLQCLYGDEQALTLETAALPARGTVVRLSIPLRRASEAA